MGKGMKYQLLKKHQKLKRIRRKRKKLNKRYINTIYVKNVQQKRIFRNIHGLISNVVISKTMSRTKMRVQKKLDL